MYGLIMADVIARWQMLQPLFIYVMADLVTRLADGIAIGSIFCMLILVLRCYTEPHPSYMWQIVLGNISIQGWIIDPDVV